MYPLHTKLFDRMCQLAKWTKKIYLIIVRLCKDALTQKRNHFVYHKYNSIRRIPYMKPFKTHMYILNFHDVIAHIIFINECAEFNEGTILIQHTHDTMLTLTSNTTMSFVCVNVFMTNSCRFKHTLLYFYHNLWQAGVSQIIPAITYLCHSEYFTQHSIAELYTLWPDPNVRSIPKFL